MVVLVQNSPKNGSCFFDSTLHIKQFTSLCSKPPKMAVTIVLFPFGPATIGLLIRQNIEAQMLDTNMANSFFYQKELIQYS